MVLSQEERDMSFAKRAEVKGTMRSCREGGWGEMRLQGEQLPNGREHSRLRNSTGEVAPRWQRSVFLPGGSVPVTAHQ